MVVWPKYCMKNLRPWKLMCITCWKAGIPQAEMSRTQGVIKKECINYSSMDQKACTGSIHTRGVYFYFNITKVLKEKHLLARALALTVKEKPNAWALVMESSQVAKTRFRTACCLQLTSRHMIPKIELNNKPIYDITQRYCK